MGRMRFAEHNGLLTHFVLEGPPFAPVVVFANSLGTELRIWNAAVEILGARVRTLRYDMRGHGLSSLGRGTPDMAALAADLAAIMDALGLRHAVVVGLSIGGMVAQALAAARPDLTRALVLCDTAPRIGDAALWQARIDAVSQGGMTALTDGVIARWFPQAVQARDPLLVEGLRTMLLRTAPEGYAALCAALRDADLTEATAALRLPTLCLCGSDDVATTPVMVRAMAALIPNARYAEIAGSGHLPPVDAPAATMAAIEAFLVEAGVL
jgi:3-oxoadipate enol-lactonase